MKEQKSQNLTLITSVLFIAAIALVALYIAPKFYEIAKINSQIKLKQEQYNLGIRKIDAIKQAGNVMKISLQEINRINVSMPLEKSADEALIIVEKIAHDNSLDLKNVQIGKSDETKSLAPIEVTMEGGFQSVTGFLNALKSNLRPVDVDSYIIEPAGDKLTFSVSLLFPYFDEKISQSKLEASKGAQSE